MTNTCLVFDIGKTNKKAVLVDEDYQIVWEKIEVFSEIVDQDGFPCEDLTMLCKWVMETFDSVRENKLFRLKAINFSAYGASFVHLGDDGQVLTPLYNYLKPFPENLATSLYTKYGGVEKFSLETGSPNLGNLNSGLQLLRFKIEEMDVFSKVKYSLHFPQYLSFLFTKTYTSELTSIGCHTALWDFKSNNYHSWVIKENLSVKLAPIRSTEKTIKVNEFELGIGIHDSSSALVPYLISIEEPFLLLSTGTWSISLNPFDNTPLTFDELKKDCLFFLNYEGKPVKASRFLLGLEHEQRTKKLTEYFGLPYDTYKSVNFEYKIIQKFKNNKVDSKGIKHDVLKQNLDEDTQIENYGSFEEAYHHLIYKLVCKQINSTKLVMNGIAVKKIFITGGFSNNSIFMNLLADEFSNIEIFAANVPHASAIGAAMVINKSWNKKCILTNNIRVKKYAKHSPEV